MDFSEKGKPEIIPERGPGFAANSVAWLQGGDHFLFGQEIANRGFDNARQFGGDPLFDPASEFVRQDVAQCGIEGGRGTRRLIDRSAVNRGVGGRLRVGGWKLNFDVEQDWDVVIIDNGVGKHRYFIKFAAARAPTLHQRIGTGKDGTRHRLFS